MSVKIDWDAPAEIVEMEGNPTPAHAQFGFLKARDGALLRNGVFMPENPRGTVILMTGYSEFIEKYFEVIDDLLARGFGVVLPEWRGHGLSERLGSEATRLHLTDFDMNLRDLEDRWARLVAPFPRPHLGLAHSMGGQISLRAAQAHPDWFDALAQSAPMHGIALPRLLHALLSAFIAGYRLFDADDNWLPFTSPATHPGVPEENHVTNDMARYKRAENLLVHTPRLQVNGTSLGWLRAAFIAMEETRQPAFLASIATPLYIATAEEEMVVDNAAHAHVLAHVADGRGDSYPNAKHELLMEKDATRHALLDNIEAFYKDIS